MHIRDNRRAQYRQAVTPVLAFLRGVRLPPLVLFAIAYFFAYRYAAAFDFNSAAPLWLPDSVLLCALLLVPRRQWLLYVLVSLPFRVWLESPSPAPLWFVLLAFVNDSLKGVLSAYLLQRLNRGRVRLNNVRQLVLFITIAAVAVPALSALLGAASRVPAGYSFWPSASQWFMGNAIASLALTPTLLLWCLGEWRTIRVPVAELVLLIIGMAACLYFTFFLHHQSYSSIILFAPVPFLIWAAARLGPIGISTANSVLALVAIITAVQGKGPFSGNYAQHSVLTMQLFLGVTSVTMLFVAMLITERDSSEGKLLETNLRLEAAYQELLKRWEFQKTLSDISAILASVPREGIDSAISKCLALVASFIGADSVTLWALGATPCRTIFWPVSPLTDDAQLFHQCPRLLNRLSLGQDFQFPALHQANAPADIELFRRLGIRSFLALPVQGGSPPISVVTMSAAARNLVWDTELVGQLHAIFESIGHALFRNGAELAVLTEHALNRAMLESLPGLAVLVGEEGLILRTNRGSGDTADSHHPLFQALTVGENYLAWLRELLAGPNRQNSLPMIDQVAMVIGGARERATLEWQLPTGNHWVEVRALRLNQPQGHSLLVHWDITPRKRAELERAETIDTIAHLNRVSSMGQMAASLAHELGQPLAAIRSNSEAARRLIAQPSPDLDEIRMALQEIIDDNSRAREVVQNLRSILHKGPVPSCDVDLNHIVNDVARLVKNDALLRGVSLRFALSSEPVTVRGAIVPLQQVILNLINNSMDSVRTAAPDRRIVTVRTAIDRARAFGCVVVEDCGPGIPDHVRSKLFSPFFTTKDDGLGLGLSICHSILQSLGGRIHLESSTQPGAAFRVELPLRVELAPAASTSAA